MDDYIFKKREISSCYPNLEEKSFKKIENGIQPKQQIIIINNQKQNRKKKRKCNCF